MNLTDTGFLVRLDNGQEIEGPTAYHIIDALVARLNDSNQHIETLNELRPHWAQGYSSDSMAAQAATGALSAIWKELGVTNQTMCMMTLKKLQGKK